MKGTGRVIRRASALALLGASALASGANAEFPYPASQQGSNPFDYTVYKLPGGTPAMPDDLTGKRVWMYAATPPEDADPTLTADPNELHGVRGAHLVDGKDVDQAWRTTTGRPDVTIAVLDSGINWSSGDMRDIRRKTRISTGETPEPLADRATATEAGADCAAYAAARAAAGSARERRDLNTDGVFDVVDYACDSRVDPDPPAGVGFTVGGQPMLDPQDVLIAFSDGTDADDNGYVDDMVGWDFLDDDNDPYDDVRYGHGTGEAKDSAGEADNGGDLGTCPNCMEIHMRVGTSFIADVNRFALAVLYAVDNDVLVVQEALGTLNKSRIGADAVEYAYDHGVAVIASAADEAAQHHNWPSSYPYSIVVNSVTHFEDADALPGSLAQSYLQFNGCTNFSSRITLAIPSVSCSSDATGRGAGMAGIVYSAALNAIESGRLDPHPTCVRTNGEPCPLSANEVRQLMASGTDDGTQMADDVNFARVPILGVSTETPCGGMSPPLVQTCTDPFLAAPPQRGPAGAFPRSYPARAGHDQFYGYGRVNMNRTVDTVTAGRVPPEVEVLSPDWYEMVDPDRPALEIRGEISARGAPYTCRVLVAPGGYPSDDEDFVAVPSTWCDGTTARTEAVEEVLASIDLDTLEGLFPANAGDFRGREPGVTGVQTSNGRPNNETYSFVVKIVATSGELAGTDRRQAYLHRDQDMLPGFPKHLPGDIEATPTLADLDGDNRNELIVANSDGLVHALRPDGSELDGYPVRTDPLPMHPGSRAVSSGAIEEAYGAVLATPAVGDLDRDGTLELVVADLENKVYVFDGATGEREQVLASNDRYAGRPAEPFANIRDGRHNRTQHGFIASPVLADLDTDDGGELEIVAAAMDRHVYAWNADGSAVPGWPVLVVDRTKVASIDPESHRATFKEDSGALMNGAIIDTPAVGDLDGDGTPEVVVGTNEEYAADADGGLNAGGATAPLLQALGDAALSLANGRLFAIRATGEPGGPKLESAPWLPGWPFKVGILQAEVLPLVGEGITGSPVIGEVPCGENGVKATVGTIPAAGVAYLIDPETAQSCQGRQDGKDVVLTPSGGAATDPVFLAAFGHPAFGELASGPAFLAPAAGAVRALDVVLPEYQGGNDYLVAWNTANGQVAPGWPARVNDLQFLTGPSIAELSATSPGTEVLAGTAHSDLNGLTSAGQPIDDSWPKLTADWSVANPVVGTFGAKETDADTRKVVIHGTRNGRLLGYATEAPACAPADWPHFHHDVANSGDGRRDAVAPGVPEEAALSDLGTLTFRAPGDDLLCGRAEAYEVRTADAPITPATFADADGVPVVATPGEPGSEARVDVPREDLGRYVAVRAIDEQGNVGRPAVVDRGPPSVRPAGPTGPAGPGSAGGGPEGSGGPVARDPRCAPRRMRFRKKRLGAFRIGRTAEQLVGAAGGASEIRQALMRWCVRGGGTVHVVFGRGARARVVASTARRHRTRRVGRGKRLRAVRREHPGLVRLRPHMYALRHGSRIVFGTRAGRVRYVAVTTKQLSRRTKRLRAQLARAGV